MPRKRTIEAFFTAASKRTCEHVENGTAANEGEIGGMIKMLGGADINEMSNFVFGLPTCYFAPPPLKSIS